MGHIGKKCIFGNIGRFCLFKSVFQHFFLFQFILDLIVYASISHDNLGNVIIVSYVYDAELEVFFFSILNNPVIGMKSLIFG